MMWPQDVVGGPYRVTKKGFIEMVERVKTECKCCGEKICYPPALVCTRCALIDPEAKPWLDKEREEQT
jgi:hypothetical protein